MKIKIAKSNLYLIIIILVVLVIFIYISENPGMINPPDNDEDGIPDSSDSDDDNDGVLDTLDVFPFDPDEWADSDGDGTGDNSDDSDGTESEGSWHTKTYTGSGMAGTGGYANSFIDLNLPPFVAGDGDIQILFTHTWLYTGDCSDDGFVWCVHDSDDSQIYHDIEYTPSTGTNPISGHWDGENNWRVFGGNNCDLSASFSYIITIKWYG